MRASTALDVGVHAPERTFGPLTRADIARFAGAGGDFNPLHLDDAVARAAGFDSVIAMGQLSAGVLAALLSDWVGVENVRRFEVRFISPYLVGETLTLTGEVVAIEGGRAAIELAALVGERAVATATASVAL